MRFALCILGDMQTVALDLPTIRKDLNLTQADLARLAGVNVSTVWRWENESVPTRGPARAFLDRLAADAATAKASAA